MALKDKFVSYYSFEETSGNLLDVHGSNDLTAVNAPETGTGIISNARDFESSSNQYFEAATSTPFSFGDEAFCFTAWINVEALPGNRCAILGKYTETGNQRSYYLGYGPTYSGFHFMLSSDGTTTNCQVVSGSEPSLATWTFVACWYDPTADKGYLQINNGTVFEGALAGGVFAGSTVKFRIGKSDIGATNLHDGLIDEVGVLTQLLTATERTWLYNSGAGRSYADIVLFDPVISTTSLPNGTTGVAYDYTLAVAGGTGSITWTKVSGNLPTGFAALPTDGSDTGQVGTGAGTYNFIVRATDANGSFDEQALSITILDAVPDIWQGMGIVPAGMLAWHHYNLGESANNACKDYSGYGNDLVSALTNAPSLTDDAINSQPAWYFDGSTSIPLVTGTISPALHVKHLFILASLNEATFSAVRGLLSDVSGSPILSGESGAARFHNFGYGIVHRLNDVAFAAANYKAPVSGKFGVIEIAITGTALGLDQIQIGQQESDTAKRWKGYFADALYYGRVLTEEERREVLEYYALRYNIWRQISSGLDVWPFQPDWAFPNPVDKPVLTSVSVSQAYKARSKGTAKIAWELSFSDRGPEELDAAKAFWDLKYPGSTFIYRDDAYSPSRDTEVRFISGITRHVNGYRNIEYSFQIAEV